jgi:hypothetical protein
MTQFRSRHIKSRFDLFRRNHLNIIGQTGESKILSQNETTLDIDYQELLLDDRWKKKRQEIINRDNGSCFICKSNLELHVHHRQYHFYTSSNRFRLPWDYEQHLLITLCKKCHTKGHQLYQVPIIYL